jgi:hypothetical protein
VRVQWVGLQQLARRWSDAVAKHDATSRFCAILDRQREQELTDGDELGVEEFVDAGLFCSQFAVLAVLATASNDDGNATGAGTSRRIGREGARDGNWSGKKAVGGVWRWCAVLGRIARW